eukprot:scaffold133839_cov32-Tisochrysis_lutea.AAC.2
MQVIRGTQDADLANPHRCWRHIPERGQTLPTNDNETGNPPSHIRSRDSWSNTNGVAPLP